MHGREPRAGLCRAPLEVEAKADESPVTKADREVPNPALLNDPPQGATLPVLPRPRHLMLQLTQETRMMCISRM